MHLRTALALLATLLLATTAQAQSLSPNPDLDLSGQGLSIAEAGAGAGGDPGPPQFPQTLTVSVGGPVVKALLYWGGFMNDVVAPGDTDLVFDGVPISGDVLGTETIVDGALVTQAFGIRADVTSIVADAVGGGPTTVDLTVEDGDLADNADRLGGLGLLVLYEDPSESRAFRVIGFDGVDYAFVRFAGTDAGETAPVVYEYAASFGDRTAQLVVFGGGGEADRPERIEITANPDVINSFDNSDGPQWDTDSIEVSIPAGADSTTVQAFSDAVGDDSLVWVLGAMRLPLPLCGDGIVDEGEECDDGNEDDFDGCRNDCTLPFCGDGIVDDGELCDDGNDVDDDGCRNDCSTPFCGDGFVDEGEQCDDGNEDDFDGCRNNCTVPFCGDGFLDEGEQCDDGNNEDGDGCSAFCEEERGGEGCTPGYWKQPHHFGSWVGFEPPGDDYGDVFGVDASFDLSLLGALSQGGGGEAALGRHAVAALLNSSNDDVSYAFGTLGVIGIVQDAYASGDFEGAKSALASENEMGCPLGRAEGEYELERAEKKKAKKMAKKARKRAKKARKKAKKAGRY